MINWAVKPNSFLFELEKYWRKSMTSIVEKVYWSAFYRCVRKCCNCIQYQKQKKKTSDCVLSFFRPGKKIIPYLRPNLSQTLERIWKELRIPEWLAKVMERQLSVVRPKSTNELPIRLPSHPTNRRCKTKIKANALLLQYRTQLKTVLKYLILSSAHKLYPILDHNGWNV